jgi:hypothetical protein
MLKPHLATSLLSTMTHIISISSFQEEIISYPNQTSGKLLRISPLPSFIVYDDGLNIISREEILPSPFHSKDLDMSWMSGIDAATFLW